MLDQRQARASWLDGARNLTSNPDTAAECFERAVTLDPGMADAWLGLHALGRRQDEALDAMAAHEGRFGQDRERSRITLASRFMIGVYVTFRLETHADLLCAIALGHARRGEFDLADAVLERVTGNAAATNFIRGRMAIGQGRRTDAIVYFRRVIGADRFLEAEARLVSAAALAEAGALGPAREHLRWVLRQDFLPAAHAEARFFLGRIARAEGDEASALHEFSLAYAESPNLPGLAEEMARAGTPRITLGTAGDTSLPPAAGSAGEDKPTAGDLSSPEPATAGAPTGPTTLLARSAGPQTAEQVIAELNRQIGQEGVKRQVRMLLAQTRAQLARRQAGLPQGRLTEHFVFTGPPGTGKTTIARTIGRLYHALGVLELGHVVEVDRSRLLGEWLGHTVARTREALDSAMGGVLFIDEAYALQTEGFGHGDAFGREAIETILKRMEDDRDKLVVIAAGYPEPMQRFLDSNPGLRSRFTTTITFAPYSSDELLQIAQLMAEDTGNVLTDDARAELASVLAELDNQGGMADPAFGNARFVRTVIEKAAQQRDLRLFADADSAPDVQAMVEITGEDVRAATNPG